MIHQPLGGVQGQATEIINEAKEIEKTRNDIYNLIAQRTKQSLEKIAADCERDRWLRASEALDYGIIDSVIPITWD
jgi:ATP-dependent Clp protease protease subunit